MSVSSSPPLCGMTVPAGHSLASDAPAALPLLLLEAFAGAVVVVVTALVVVLAVVVVAFFVVVVFATTLAGAFVHGLALVLFWPALHVGVAFDVVLVEA